MLTPLPYPNVDHVYTFVLSDQRSSGAIASDAHINTWLERSDLFEHVAAFRRAIVKQGVDQDREIVIARATPSFFPAFGATAALGRLIGDDDAQQRVAVVGYDHWTHELGSDASVIGTPIYLDGVPYTIIGVMQPEFDREEFNPTGVPFTGGQPRAWVPMYIRPGSEARASNVIAFATLRPAISLSVANQALTRTAAEFRSRFPELGPFHTFTLVPYARVALGDSFRRLQLLIASAVLALVVAAANVGNLGIVRATALKRELAIRAALGAERRQLIGFLLREHLSIATASTMLGIALGFALRQVVFAISAGSIARSQLRLHAGSVVFVFGVTIMLGFAIASGPAVVAVASALGRQLAPTLYTRGNSAPRLGRWRASALVSQVAAAVVLVYGMAMLLDLFVQLRTTTRGFDGTNVITMRMSFNGPAFEKTAAMSQVTTKAIDRVQKLPGVQAIGLTCCLPLDRSLNMPFSIVGRPETGTPHGEANWSTISPGFFESLHISVVAGRTISSADDAHAAPVAVINRAMADANWPGGAAIGESIVVGREAGPEFADSPRQIVGIVDNVRNVSLVQAPRPAIYVPTAQLRDPLNALMNRLITSYWIVRTLPEARLTTSSIEDELRAATGLGVTRVRTMAAVIQQSTSGSDTTTAVVTLFGVASLLLAAIGVYGMMSYFVEQQRNDNAVRLAFGATPSHIRRRVMSRGMAYWTAGLVAGSVAIAALQALTATWMPVASVSTPWLKLEVAAALVAIGAVSVWGPAARASRESVLHRLAEW
jgi:predicted permease